MKFAKIKNAKLKNSEGILFLILESKQDVIDYFNFFSNKISEDSLDFWIKAKKGNNQTLTYISHQRVPNNLTHEIAYRYIESKTTKNNEVTFFDYCRHINSLYIEKYKNMLTIINDNNSIIVNELGGYCPFDDFFISIEEIFNPDIETIKSFLLGKLKIASNEEILLINDETIVIENDSFISMNLLTLIQSFGIKNYYILNDFETKTLGYNKKDFYHMFNNALKNGLKEIFLETTLIKKNQFKILKSIVESVLIKNPKKKLKVHILRNGFNHNIKSKVKNIEIINY